VDSDLIGRSLLVLGLVIALIGVGVLVFSRIPFIGRLPGDISFERDGFSFFFPLVTCVLLSIILTVIINVAIRLF
jgi:DUF2905 family protein